MTRSENKLAVSKIVYLLLSILILSNCSEQVDIEELSFVETNFEQPRDITNARTKAQIISPYGGSVYTDESQMSIQWGLITCVCGEGDWASPFIHIDLYKGSSFVQRIASNVAFNSAPFVWNIPYLDGYVYGNNLKIRITATDNANKFHESEQFTINFSGRGASFNKPIEVGVLNTCQNYSNSKNSLNYVFQNIYGGPGDDVIYKFTLNSSSYVSIGNCNDIHDYRVHLLNQSLSPIPIEIIDYCLISQTLLPAGTYYVVSEAEDDNYPFFSYTFTTNIWTSCN